jgi:hypothetical protein
MALMTSPSRLLLFMMSARVRFTRGYRKLELGMCARARTEQHEREVRGVVEAKDRERHQDNVVAEERLQHEHVCGAGIDRCAAAAEDGRTDRNKSQRVERTAFQGR